MGIDILSHRIPDESPILSFLQLLEKNTLAWQVLDTPSATKIKHDVSACGMHQSKRGKQWHITMKANIGTEKY